MGFVKGFLMSLGMFSIIPVPKNSWNDKYMPLIIPCLPIVGAIIGLLWYGAARAAAYSSMPLMTQCAVILSAPLFLSGFIHADGYMDTADAVFSRRGLEEKKRILKDPNVGAFAVIALVMLVLFQFCAVHAVLSEKEKSELLAIAFIPAVSRCVVSAALMTLKPAFETGYNASFKNGTKPRHTAFVCLFGLICLVSAWKMLGGAALPLLAEILAGIVVTARLYKQFDGLSGDLCGCVITVSELVALLFMAL